MNFAFFFWNKGKPKANTTAKPSTSMWILLLSTCFTFQQTCLTIPSLSLLGLCRGVKMDSVHHFLAERDSFFSLRKLTGAGWPIGPIIFSQFFLKINFFFILAGSAHLALASPPLKQDGVYFWAHFSLADHTIFWENGAGPGRAGGPFCHP